MPPKPSSIPLIHVSFKLRDMETKHQKLEKSSEQIAVWSLEDDDLSGSGSHVKSYTCSFCKKGFSNAQALGGHMNIHRRDRAKLRESSEENILSLDINVKTTNQPPLGQDHYSQVSEIILESSEEKSSSSPKIRSCKPSRDIGDDGASASASPKGKDAIAHKQLPLFVEGTRVVENEDQESLRLIQGSSSQIELDLELRLGPEPHQETTSKNTREFF